MYTFHLFTVFNPDGAEGVALYRSEYNKKNTNNNKAVSLSLLAASQTYQIDK